MPVIPPRAPVAVWIDGCRVQQYVRAYAWHGRVYAPVSALLRRLADEVWWDGSTLVVRRATRQARVPVRGGSWASMQTAFVAIAPVLRALGDGVTYDAVARRLDVRTAAAQPLATPTPYVPIEQATRPVFTPTVTATPNPVWTGSPLPRRTPLPSSGAPP